MVASERCEVLRKCVVGQTVLRMLRPKHARYVFGVYIGHTIPAHTLTLHVNGGDHQYDLIEGTLVEIVPPAQIADLLNNISLTFCEMPE